MTAHFPDTAHFPGLAMQRSQGEARVSLTAASGQTRLQGLRQCGAAKAILPRGTGAEARPEVVFLNTSGGLTGGDRLSYGLVLGAGAEAVATTQTAERVYRSAGGEARVEVTLEVGAGGWLDWLPQETILFDGAALSRQTGIALAPGAGCLALEAVVLGRAAMGETVTRLAFRDQRRISRDGRPLMLEPLSLQGDMLTHPAVLGGARAFASLVRVAPDAGDALEALRGVLDEPGVEAAASALEGRLVCRMRAGDGWPLRRQIRRALAVLRRGAALPRVWQE